MEPIEIAYGVLVFIVSLCIGSFLNVVIYRLPNKMSLSKPASHCPTCNNPIKWYDNIPILSYLFLGGKCRHCKEKISIRYLIVEATTAVIATLIYIRFGLTPLSFLSIIVFYCFVAIFFIDAKHYEIPDSLVIIIALVGIVSIFIAPLDYAKGDFSITYVDKLISLAVSLALLVLVMLFEKILKRELIGGGDIKLFAAVGLFIGWQLALLGVMLAAIIGVLVEIPFSKLLKREKAEGSNSSVLPFGPYLVIGFMISLLFGLNILSFYMSMIEGVLYA